MYSCNFVTSHCKELLILCYFNPSLKYSQNIIPNIKVHMIYKLFTMKNIRINQKCLIRKRVLYLPTIKLYDLKFPATKGILVKSLVYRRLFKRLSETVEKYFLNLRSLHYTDLKKISHSKVHDFVLVHEENLTRNGWEK